MESLPSNIINKEFQKPFVVDSLTTSLQASAFESPSRFTVLEVMDEGDKGWKGDKTFYQVPKLRMGDGTRKR